jgi:hypothetical protein
MYTRLLIAFVVAASAVAFAGDGAKARPKNNVTGTFDCSCHRGSGTCSMRTVGGVMICNKGGGTCTGKCELSTTSTGATKAQ